jgi:effector-binding domain-containing protein
MKTLLKILYFLLFIVIIFLLAGLFLPKAAQVDSAIVINASNQIVFDQINDLKNWEAWSPWQEADSSMKVTYATKTKGTGASYSWTSQYSGKGKLTIAESTPLNEIKIDIDFADEGNAKIEWMLEPEENMTKVTWTFLDDNLSYFERYFMFLFKKNMKSTLKSGLKKLKKTSEELRLSRISAIKIVELEKQPAMIIVDSSKVDEMDERMTSLFSKLTSYLGRRGMQATGLPFTIYYSWNPDGLSKFACGLPIAQKTWGWKEYSVIELPEGKAATLVHWGKYDSEKPYVALDNYIMENKLTTKDLIWEVYLNDPKIETDTAKWQKQIYYPLLETQ